MKRLFCLTCDEWKGGGWVPHRKSIVIIDQFGAPLPSEEVPESQHEEILVKATFIARCCKCCEPCEMREDNGVSPWSETPSEAQADADATT